MSLYPHSEVDLDYFTENMPVGGSGGGRFSHMEQSAVLKRLEVWQEDWRIRSIKVTFTNGTKVQYGKSAGRYFMFEFKDGEYMTKLNIQPSGTTSKGGLYRLGAIWFTTAGSRSSNWGVWATHLKDDTNHWVDIGSGLCCGVFGAGGDDIDNFGMAILRDMERSELTDVTYPHLDMQAVATVPTYSESGNFDNGSGTSQQSFTLTLEKTVTKEKEWSFSDTIGVGVELTVSAGFPLVADVSSTLSWTVSSTTSQSQKETVTEEVSHSWTVNVGPGKVVKATGMLYADNITTDFTGEMKIYLKNGKVYKYPVEGIYEGADYGRWNFVVDEEY